MGCHVLFFDHQMDWISQPFHKILLYSIYIGYRLTQPIWGITGVVRWVVRLQNLYRTIFRYCKGVVFVFRRSLVALC